MDLLRGEWLTRIACLLVTALTTPNAIVQKPCTAAPPPHRTANTVWSLTWNDEFDQADGSPPDPKKWKLEVGGNGWGNHELEYYTNRAMNASVRQGQLVIEARREEFRGRDGVRRGYTSARLTTQGLFAQAYG